MWDYTGARLQLRYSVVNRFGEARILYDVNPTAVSNHPRTEWYAHTIGTNSAFLRAAIVALPPLTFLVWWQVNTDFDAVRIFLAFFALSTPFDVALAVGWAAAIIWWAQGGALPALKARVAAVGAEQLRHLAVERVVARDLPVRRVGDLV